MDCLISLGLLLALSLFLCTSSYCFVLVYLPTSTAHLAICWALFLWVCHSTIFTVLYHFLFLYTLPLLYISILTWSLPISSYQIKLFCNSVFFPLLLSMAFVLPPSEPKLKHVYCLLYWYLLEPYIL